MDSAKLNQKSIFSYEQETGIVTLILLAFI